MIYMNFLDYLIGQMLYKLHL